MNLNSKKLTIPDLISVGVFTAIYFVLVTIATFSCALLPGVGNILLPAVAALISGSVYMLLAAKLQKFGGISIMGLVMGLFFFMSGHFVLSFAANIVCGVLADWVASRSQYRSKKVLLASYVIFSYGLTGPILPLWFMKDAYIANLTARGKDASYINTLFAPINSGSFLVCIVAILVCALLGGGTLIFLKLSAKHKKSKNKDKEELAQITANEFVNVKDIRGNFLYTRDNLALAYLKIYPISTELFSKNEKRLIAKQLTVSLSSAQYPFQLLAVSRPVDISPLLSELSATLTSSSDVKQKELLKQEIVEMGAFALSGEVVERQFYIKIWDRVSDGVERDLLQKLKLLGGYFSDSGIQTEILQQQDIVRLCNLVNNPAYVHLEDSGINAAIPILESVGVA